MKTSELIGAALDWAVAKCEGHDVEDPTWWPDLATSPATQPTGNKAGRSLSGRGLI